MLPFPTIRFAAIATLLLVPTVLAVSSSQLEARLARRRNHRGLPVLIDQDESGVEYYNIWSGVIWDKEDGTFTAISGTFTVPNVTGSDGVSSAWVGIDGRGCGDGLLQAGVDFTITNGEPSYDAWYEWYPNWSHDFPTGMTVSPGDVIRTTVTASSTTSGTVIMENLTTDQVAIKAVSSHHALCLGSVEWIVEDFEGDNGTPLANFSSVTFTNAVATGPHGKFYTPLGATVAKIRQNGAILTSVHAEESTVTIGYI